jgi:hypothetical protein
MQLPEEILNGGGIYIIGNANPTINGCSINNNASTNQGGGLYSTSTAWLML